MSATRTMDANPYSAPDAELGGGGGGNDTYDPSIFSFDGRIGRLRYLAYSVGMIFLLMLVMIPLVGVSALAGGEEGMSLVGMLVMAVFYIGAIVFSVMFAKRRLNDLNRSGWWFLLSFVPVVNLLLTIYLVFFPGTEGSNNWGPAPGPNSLGVQILGWLMPVLFILGIVAAVMFPMMVGVQPQ
jgi:uncharacterized membrane protein YhaH (DUF805 family)